MKKSESSISVKNCIRNLKAEGIWKPLPERENEIDFINVFFNLSFKSEIPSFLIISGPKFSGKTSVCHTCILMSEFERHILFLDCSDEDVYNFNVPTDGYRRLAILDNFILQKNFDLIPFLHDINFSIIIIMEQYEEINNLPVFENISRINFSRYNKFQIKNILLESMKDCSSIVHENIISRIACEVYDKSGSILDAFQILIEYLQSTISEDA